MESTWPTVAKATFWTFRPVRQGCSLKSVGQCLSVGSTPPAILAKGAERMTTIDESRGGTHDTAVWSNAGITDDSAGDSAMLRSARLRCLTTRSSPLRRRPVRLAEQSEL